MRYSIFESGIYGSPPAGMVGSIGFNLNNVLEMKVFSKKDTIKHEKKIKLLESFNITGNYNIAADSLKMSVIGINGRTTFAGNNLTLDFGLTLDPYQVDSMNRRINKFVFTDERKFTRLTNTRLALTSRFQSQQVSSQPPPQQSLFENEDELMMIERDRDLYYDFNIPWSFSFSYYFGLSRGEMGDPDKYLISRNSIDFNFDANITPRWKVTLQTGYDLQLKDLVFTTVGVIRDLHCWVLSFDWVPYPIEFQRYSMQLNVKSAILQDMKITRRKERFDSVFVG